MTARSSVTRLSWGTLNGQVERTEIHRRPHPKRASVSSDRSSIMSGDDINPDEHRVIVGKRLSNAT